MEEIVKQIRRPQNIMLGEYGTNIKIGRELKRCRNVVMVGYIDEIDENRKYIKDHEQKG